ncbi:MAG: response regulator transcription factor [Actinomycetota bacterium]|nr:response regulator transcription factor [Actinomycetota bacterium]
MDAERGLRVLVVDDHDVVHWGFKLLLERQPWVERCVSAGGAAQALELSSEVRPDVVLVDLFLGTESGAELCSQLRESNPETRILLISGAGRISPAVARAAGASGFVAKDWAAPDILRAVRMVALGKEVFAAAGEPNGSRLTDREQEVVALISEGATNAEIASRLYLSPHTIKEHTSSVYRKLGVRNRAEAVRAAQRLGLVS